ncbi:mitochondrial acidic protein MAM33 [Lotus japonicus]|uniref:mitochondrial acidic protein MAM33 n=1 Tax=Lotus japonicus TaxID=34305 RepID=UPI00258E3323|nr:mitochondrial acidic protein MAM33 [Lotus japonicus]
MWKRGLVGAVGALRRAGTSRPRYYATMSSAVDSMILRSLKDHYMEVSKMNMPPRVSPPSPFSIVKGALDSNGPVLKRSYGEEEVIVYVMRLSSADDDDGAVGQLFIHVDVSKPTQNESLIFLCGLYEDALGIHSVSMRPKLTEHSGYIIIPSQYTGPVFAELDERTRDAFHSYIEERGVNESLFKFLQAWLYVKEHRNLMRWFKTMGLFIDGKKPAAGA